MTFLTEEPIVIEHLIRRVSRSDRGGVATFVGTVRNHHEGREVARLEYSAYGTMAEAEIGRIAQEAEERWSCQVAVEHRTGGLKVGDIAVAVAVGAPHREEAFDSCRYVIEELKRRVPIWKREGYVDGTAEWVDPTATQAPVGGEQ